VSHLPAVAAMAVAGGRTRTTRGVALAASIVLLAGACAGGSASTPPSATTSPSSTASAVAPTPSPAAAVAWRACGSGLECTRIAVPLDHARPSGQAIWIYLARRPATDPAHRLGSLVLNYGGPGGSGITMLRHQATSLLPEAVQARFDLVSFDPRGVGLSSPVTCVDDATMDRLRTLDPRPTTTTALDATLAAARAFAAGCERQSGALLPYVSTEAVARDLDQIREALGEQRLTYLGYSYGTYLGARYGTLFPDRVRAFVLDAAIDATMDPLAVAKDQTLAYEAALDRFLADCSARAACAFHGGGKADDAFDVLMAQIERAPIPAGGNRTLGPADAQIAIMNELRTASWPDLATGLAAAASGDGSILLGIADLAVGRSAQGQYDNSVAAGDATVCMDAPKDPDLASAQALAARLAKAAPRLGGAPIVGCTFWPVRPVTAPAPLVAPSGTPLLVVGGTLDPATPYAWSQRMVASLGNAVLVTRRGEGHTTMVDPSARCLDIMARYLVDLEVPGADASC
jgi:pimeloyl-ACP methyl ester carboxylesterase